MNRGLKPFTDNLVAQVKTPTEEPKVLSEPFSPYNMLQQFNTIGGLFVKRTNEMRVWRYRGSLTTPGCNEKMAWFLHRDPQYMSMDQVSVHNEGRITRVSLDARCTSNDSSFIIYNTALTFFLIVESIPASVGRRRQGNERKS